MMVSIARIITYNSIPCNDATCAMVDSEASCCIRFPSDLIHQMTLSMHIIIYDYLTLYIFYIYIYIYISFYHVISCHELCSTYILHGIFTFCLTKWSKDGHPITHSNLLFNGPCQPWTENPPMMLSDLVLQMPSCFCQANHSHREIGGTLGMVPLLFNPPCWSPLKGEIYPINIHCIRCICGWLLRGPHPNITTNFPMT